MAEWIEMARNGTMFRSLKSPLAMAEWIEIVRERRLMLAIKVSASDGGVD